MPRRDGHTVYVIAMGEDRCKIGVTRDPEQRLRNLTTGSCEPLRIYAEFNAEDAGALEREALRIMAPCRMRGEWFDAPASVACAILHYLNVGDALRATDTIAAWAEFMPLHRKVMGSLPATTTLYERARNVELGSELLALGLLPDRIAHSITILRRAMGLSEAPAL